MGSSNCNLKLNIQSCILIVIFQIQAVRKSLAIVNKENSDLHIFTLKMNFSKQSQTCILEGNI